MADRGSSGEDRLERDSFIVLQHVYSITGADPGCQVPRTQVGEELSFASREVDRLIEHLVGTGCLVETGLRVSITQHGIDYVERLAGGRRSVRK